MTYGQVLLWFVVPPIILLLPWGLSGLRAYGVRGWWSVPAVALIAFLYATPWDNYLIWRGVWNSPPDRIVGRILHVPVEEYGFFVLQPLLTGAWFGVVLRRLRLQPLPAGSNTGALAWTGVLAAGIALWSRSGTLYLGTLLAWAALPLAGMWWYRGRWLRRNLIPMAAAVIPPTLYLWWVDRLALAEGTWFLSPDHTVGVSIVGLPIEEALFFLLTNILVVTGMGLFLEPSINEGSAPPSRLENRT